MLDALDGGARYVARPTVVGVHADASAAMKTRNSPGTPGTNGSLSTCSVSHRLGGVVSPSSKVGQLR